MSDYKLTVYADQDGRVGHFSIGVHVQNFASRPCIDEDKRIARNGERDDEQVEVLGTCCKLMRRVRGALAGRVTIRCRAGAVTA